MIKLGDIYLRCKKNDYALKSYSSAISFAKILKMGYDDSADTSFEIMVQAYLRMIKMFLETNQQSQIKKYYLKAIKTSKKALKYHRTEKTYRQLFHLYGEMGDWCKNNKNIKAACKYYNEAICLSRESVLFFKQEQDVLFLASAYLIVGTIPGKDNELMLKKSMELWEELLQKNPSSEKYKSGYNLTVRGLENLNNK